MAITIYFDFTSAESFALSEVAAALDRPPEMQWRGIETEPDLPVPMAALDRRT